MDIYWFKEGVAFTARVLDGHHIQITGTPPGMEHRPGIRLNAIRRFFGRGYGFAEVLSWCLDEFHAGRPVAMDFLTVDGLSAFGDLCQRIPFEGQIVTVPQVECAA
jgi:hypothetical protein